MSLNSTKVAVTRHLPADIEERMGELFDTRFNQTDAALYHMAHAILEWATST